jgi:hypothetical protein
MSTWVTDDFLMRRGMTRDDLMALNRGGSGTMDLTLKIRADATEALAQLAARQDQQPPHCEHAPDSICKECAVP